MNDWYLKFWGVRGSIPVPGPSTVKYGGNTACLELKSGEGDWLIFDAGTGLKVLGDAMDLSKKYVIHLLISHPHWDHINGFPFFTPIYIPGNKITVYGPSTFEHTIEEIMNGQMKYTYFPVRTAELLAELKFKDIKEEELVIGNFTIQTVMLNHPVTCVGYKVKYKGSTFVYLGDNEPYYNVYNDNDPEVIELTKNMNSRLVEFVRGADTIVLDSQYIPSEYASHKGWGHSTTHDAVNLALKAEIKQLFFFHHDPQRSDLELDKIVKHYRDRIAAKGYNLQIDAAREGENIRLL